MMASTTQTMRARHPVSFSVRWSWWAVAPVVVAAAACATPWLLARWPEVGFALQRGFALVCHQQAERSFIVFGGSVAVCARCLGIYIGAVAGLLLRVSRRVAWRWLMAAVAINVVDWFAEFGGVHGNWMGARFVLGISLGVAAAMMVVACADVGKTPTQAKEA